MQLRPVGDAAWRLELPEGVDRAAVLERLRALPRVRDVVVADRHALVAFAPGEPPDDPRPIVEACPRDASLSARVHVVRVRYDGPDLDEVARTVALTRDEVVALHAREYTVEMVGFMPGFAYLGPLDSALHVPRRPAPRARVPALSVGIAAGRTGIYPFTSPGGWHLVGTAVDFTPFDRERGATLRLGDRVLFERADP